MRRIPFLKRLVREFGIDPRRLRLEWVSASEGDRFALVVNEFTKEIRSFGPLTLPVHAEMAKRTDHSAQRV
jgi:F420-non-reducing hydrogenase iron-sulfur subunit